MLGWGGMTTRSTQHWHLSPEVTWVRINVPSLYRPLMELMLSFPPGATGPHQEQGIPGHPSLPQGPEHPFPSHLSLWD